MTRPMPPIVDRQQWEDAQRALDERTTALEEARRALGAERRRMPMHPVDAGYRFLGPDGEVGLAALFEGRSQLVTYRFFFDPDVDGWPEAGCEGCSMYSDSVTDLAHLHARDVTYAALSKAPPERLAAYAARMGWSFPWYTLLTGDGRPDFSADFGVSEWFGLNVFLRDHDAVYRTSSVTGPYIEGVGSAHTLLELTPYGRQQSDERSPAGWPQSDPYAWYRRHDEYATLGDPAPSTAH